MTQSPPTPQFWTPLSELSMRASGIGDQAKAEHVGVTLREQRMGAGVY
jgi:hypothetical protein